MRLEDVRDNIRVRVVRLNEHKGWNIDQKNIKARQQGVEGLVIGCAAGHGGEVFWVSHGGGDIAAYSSDELEPA